MNTIAGSPPSRGRADGTAVPLTRLLRPRSVAIVGISPEPGSLGATVLANLLRVGFAGDVHLVSRTSREIDGRRCFGAIDELPEGVDVAVLALPRQAAVEAVTACVRRKIGAALVFASGFAEMDEDGRIAQETMARVAREGALALCGPNCIGFVNLTERVALTFEPLTLPPPYPSPPAGEAVGRAIGVVTQSGAMCSTLRLALLAKELNLSCVVSTGNESVLTTEDFLAFLIDDEATQVIVLFMEQVRDPGLFLALAARARSKGKPIVLMHPGRSVRAQASARTHTGAMAGDHAVMATLVAREAVVLRGNAGGTDRHRRASCALSEPSARRRRRHDEFRGIQRLRARFRGDDRPRSARALAGQRRGHQRGAAGIRRDRKSGRCDGAEHPRRLDPRPHRGAPPRRSGDGQSRRLDRCGCSAFRHG